MAIIHIYHALNCIRSKCDQIYVKWNWNNVLSITKTAFLTFYVSFSHHTRLPFLTYTVSFLQRANIHIHIHINATSPTHNMSYEPTGLTQYLFHRVVKIQKYTNNPTVEQSTMSTSHLLIFNSQFFTPFLHLTLHTHLLMKRKRKHHNNASGKK